MIFVALEWEDITSELRDTSVKESSDVCRFMLYIRTKCL